MRNDRERLLDITDAIAKIEKYASRGRVAFESDELVQTWMLHHLQIIGEATRGLSQVRRTSGRERAAGCSIGPSACQAVTSPGSIVIMDGCSRDPRRPS